ncbi:MAG: c-type cytochrome, partial [Planctomycetales bacterium]|nr:c-type cytochrome [Planctomycetales bacterium]
VLAAALQDADGRLRLTAVRWIADEKLKQYEPQLVGLLDDSRTSPRLFAAVVAALDWLERGQVSRQYRHDYDRRLAPILRDEQKSAAIRATALRLLSVDSPAISVDELAKLARADDSAIAREATRLLALRGDEAAVNRIVELANDDKLSAGLRADAVVGLASAAERHRESIARLADDDAAEVAREAKRISRTADNSPSNSAASNDSPNRPAADDVDAWLARVQDGGDANAGWRVFFSAAGGRCAACHTLDGRGAAIGPDLTRIGSRMGKRRVLESILHPSREIAPTYQPFVIEMADGRTFSGLTLGRFDGDKKERIVGADGREITLDVPNIERRTESKLSIMPQGLEQGLSDQDLRDLLALLSRND